MERTDLPQLPPRVSDWQTGLTEYLANCSLRKFEEGRHDCALFAAGAVQVMIGMDLSVTWAKYDSTIAGLRMLREHGFQDHIELVASIFEEVPVAFANAGDLAVFESEDGPAIGVVQGEAVYGAGPTGLNLIGLLEADRAFRV